MPPSFGLFTRQELKRPKGAAPKKAPGSPRTPRQKRIDAPEVDASEYWRRGLAGVEKMNPEAKTVHMAPRGTEEPHLYVLGESPGCISGDSLIETAFRDKSVYPDGIPIKDLVGQSGFHVYSFDSDQQEVVLGKVTKVWKTGTKKVYRVTYEWRGGHGYYFTGSIVVTSNHPFLIKRKIFKDPFVSVSNHGEYISIDQGLSVGHSLQPFYRRTDFGYAVIGSEYKKMFREARFLLGCLTGSPLREDEDCHHEDENILNDTPTNLRRLTQQEHWRHHSTKNNPMHDPEHRDRHRQAMQTPEYRKGQSERVKAHLSDPEVRAARVAQIRGRRDVISRTVKENYNDPEKYLKYLLTRRNNVRVKGGMPNRKDRNLAITLAVKDWQENGGSISSVAIRHKVNYVTLHARIQELKTPEPEETFEEWVNRKFKEKFPDLPTPLVDNHKIIKIEELGEEDVYDMEVEKYHNFAVNGIFVHNSQEDAAGQPFVGPSGDWLREALPRGWFDSYCRINNVCRTFPPLRDGNRTPTFAEVEHYRPSVTSDIERTQPLVILAVGGLAASWCTGNLGTVVDVRGKKFPCKIGSHVCWVYPIHHPAFLRRIADSRFLDVPGSEWINNWHRDIDRVVADIRAGLPEPVVEDRSRLHDGCTVNDGSDPDAILAFLEYLKYAEIVSIDYETNATRPYHPSSKLLSVAVGDENETLAFPLFHPGAKYPSEKKRDQVLAAYRDLLRTDVPKLAHNAPFEVEWSAYTFGRETLRAGGWHCTQAQAYVLGGVGGLSLNFLTAQYLGFPLKSVSDVDRKYLEQTPLDSVLKYNGLDTKYTLRLFNIQKKVVKAQGLLDVYRQQVRRIPALVAAQLEGVPTNQDRVVEFRAKCEKEKAPLVEAMKARPEVKQFEADTGLAFNPASPKKILVPIFRDYLQRKEGERKGGSYTTGDEVLTEMAEKGVALAKMMQNWRRWAKIQSTYVEPMDRAAKDSVVWPDGKLHCQYKPTSTRTRRLSSADPNQQNWTKREDAWVRAIVEPPAGWTIVACDYGQIEYRVVGMASRDKVLCDSCFTGYDVHAEWAEKILKVWDQTYRKRHGKKDPKKAFKAFRGEVKNQFVFPLIYGSACAPAAAALEMPVPKLQPLYDEFWDTFKGVKERNQRLLRTYREKGYVELLTGFRRYGPMSDNMVVNTESQGTASDIVVDGMCRLAEMAEATDTPYLAAVLNVHDDLTFLVPDNKVDEALQIIVREMLSCRFPFINVPLVVEASTGKNWAEMHVVGVYRSDTLGVWSPPNNL